MCAVVFQRGGTRRDTFTGTTSPISTPELSIGRRVHGESSSGDSDFSEAPRARFRPLPTFNAGDRNDDKMRTSRKLVELKVFCCGNFIHVNTLVFAADMEE